MSSEKKRARQQFRDAVFARDGHRCKCCGWSIFVDGLQLDAHHITDRTLMPNGGYVKENGISLCPECHKKAETFHQTGTAPRGWAPDDMYAKIGSSHQEALRADSRLK